MAPEVYRTQTPENLSVVNGSLFIQSTSKHNVDLLRSSIELFQETLLRSQETYFGFPVTILVSFTFPTEPHTLLGHSFSKQVSKPKESIQGIAYESVQLVRLHYNKLCTKQNHESKSSCRSGGACLRAMM